MAELRFTSPVSVEERRGLLILQTTLIERLPATIDVKMTHLNGIPCLAMQFLAGTSKGQTWGVRCVSVGGIDDRFLNVRLFDSEGREYWSHQPLEQLVMDAELCAEELNREIVANPYNRPK